MKHAEKLPVVKDGMRVMYIRDYAVEQKEHQLSYGHWVSDLTRQRTLSQPLPS